MRLCKRSSNKQTSLNRKIVVCGDGACGKTSLLSVFTRDYFPQLYEPTVFENYVKEITIDDQLVELSLWDTAGQEEFDRIRLLSYEDTHVFLLCFSIDNSDSLQNIPDKWLEEVTENCPLAKLILVALKCDLRESDTPDDLKHGRRNEKLILYEEGLDMAKRINALRYLECSAKHNRGVKECFEQTAKVALSVKSKPSHKSKESKCVIL